MNPFLYIILVMSLVFTPITSQALISSNIVPCESGMADVECRKIVTEYRDDENGEWLKAGVVFQFRSTNNKSCNVHGKLANSNNMHMIYKTASPKASGEWTKPGLVIKQIKEGAWSHSATWKIDCK